VDLVAAVRAASEGRRYLSPRLAEAIVANYMRPADRDPLRTLAPREREVLCAIASGKTTKQIAFGLGVATKTVETHRRRLMEKLRLYSVAELTQFALREGLIELETNAC
jgi:DNA-binding NarL/FixJ family response regulator